jgi:hypothetical protein
LIDWQVVIKEAFKQEKVRFTNHARKEMEDEPSGEIIVADIIAAISELEVLAEYPSDKPYPSALILGFNLFQRPIHFVVAFEAATDSLIVVTVYQPDPAKWINFRKRI